MKKLLYSLLLILLVYMPDSFANMNSGTELENALKDTSSDPSLSTIIFALLFVIFLIYITGIIYSKLNAAGAKAAKDQFRNYDLNRAVILSTTQIGQNRNLHVIEVNDRCYLIGATPNSINLIKDLGEYTNKKEQRDYEKPEDVDIDKAIRVLYGKNNEEPVAVSSKKAEFDVHKKYL